MIEDDNQVIYPRPSGPTTDAPAPASSSTLARILLLSGFTLLDYIRSGRIVVEVGLSMALYFIFLQGGATGISAEKFFSLTGIFALIITIYTTSTIIGLGDRPQGYLILARRMGRASYLFSFYLSAVMTVTMVYLLLSLATAAFSSLTDLTVTSWGLGSLPLLLNAGLMAALILLLSPLVLSTGWRLFVLGLIALAFSKNFLGNATVDGMPPIVQTLLDSLQTILGWPMVPAFSGFALSLSRDYSGSAPVILVAQSSLLVALLGLAIYAFSRRELVLSVD